VSEEENYAVPGSGGNLKYALIGLLLLLGAVGLYLFGGSGSGTEGAAVASVGVPDAGIASPTRRIEQHFDLPEEVPDAGPDAATDAPTDAASRRRRQPRAAGCEGDIPREALVRAIEDERRQVRNCYERALKTNSVLQGTVNVQVRIGSSGRVEEARVGGSIRDSEVRACVRRLARGWRFPAPTGGCADVNVPFNLSPQQR